MQELVDSIRAGYQPPQSRGNCVRPYRCGTLRGDDGMSRRKREPAIVTVNLPPTIPRVRVARPVRVTAALLTLVVILSIWGGTRTLTTYDQRGVVTTMPPADAPLVAGNVVGVQVFLDKEVDFANVR